MIMKYPAELIVQEKGQAKFAERLLTLDFDVSEMV